MTDLEKVEAALARCERDAKKPNILVVWARNRKEAMAKILELAR